MRRNTQPMQKIQRKPWSHGTIVGVHATAVTGLENMTRTARCEYSSSARLHSWSPQEPTDTVTCSKHHSQSTHATAVSKVHKRAHVTDALDAGELPSSEVSRADEFTVTLSWKGATERRKAALVLVDALQSASVQQAAENACNQGSKKQKTHVMT